jgi:hypothetical protein
MPIVITSKRNGFRRCGMAHPARAVEHPDGAFSPEQLKELQAEPMLVVQVVGIPQVAEAQEDAKPAEPEADSASELVGGIEDASAPESQEASQAVETQEDAKSAEPKGTSGKPKKDGK